jgi:hypothetical protein
MNRSFTNLTDLFDDSCSVQHTTSLHDLMGDDEALPVISFVNTNREHNPHSHSHAHSHGDSQTIPPCTIRCTDILEHITKCPVCSKLYKPVDNGQQYNTRGTSFDNNKKYKLTFAFVTGIMLIIILILLKTLLVGKST